MLTYTSMALVLVLMLNVLRPAWGGTVSGEPAARLDAELDAAMKDPACPLASLSVLVMRDGQVVVERQIGFRWIDNDHPERSKPVDAKTLYRIASISKLITTIGVMKLIEEKKLDLDTDVSQYLGFELRNPHFPKKPITLRMMLSHTSSLRDDAGYYFDLHSGLTLSDVLMPGGKGFGEGKMWATNAGPGEFFSYANLPWGVIGTMMERVSGERFDKLMRRLVLDPMNLPGGFSPADFSTEEIANVATLYRKRLMQNDAGPWNPQGPWIVQTDDFVTSPPPARAKDDYVIGTNGTLFGPQGNCRLSAAGLGRVMQMLMNNGTLDGRQILSPASVELMLKEQWKHHGNNGNSGGENSDQDIHAMNSWGLGVQRFLDITGDGVGDRLVEPGGFSAVGHMGEAYGLTSAMVFNREKNIGLIYLVGGVGNDPDRTPGKYSAMWRYEERILTALWNAAKSEK